jgi:hypothetical protein
MKPQTAIIPIDRDVHAIAKWCARRRGITIKRFVEQSILFEERCITDYIQHGLKACGCGFDTQCGECALPERRETKIARLLPRSAG